MAKVNKAKTKSRRAYFRIYDEVNLFYKKINEKLVTDTDPVVHAVLNSYSLSTDHKMGSQNSAELLSRLEKNLPDVADYLRLIDTKMDLLAQDVVMPGSQFNEKDTRNVNLSASGMAFNSSEMLKAGDYLIIKILLESCETAIVTYAKVVYCKMNPVNESRHPYVVGAEFIKLKDQDRDALIQHVDKKRWRQLGLRGFILAAAITVITLPDVVFGLLFELLHFLFEHILEFSHIAFEFVELALDNLVEHLFETDLQQTQVIVFYIMLSFVCYGLYHLWRVVPRFCLRCKQKQILYWSRKKAALLYYWQEQSLFNKIKLLAIGVAAITGYVLFGM